MGNEKHECSKILCEESEKGNEKVQNGKILRAIIRHVSTNSSGKGGTISYVGRSGGVKTLEVPAGKSHGELLFRFFPSSKVYLEAEAEERRRNGKPRYVKSIEERVVGYANTAHKAMLSEETEEEEAREAARMFDEFETAVCESSDDDNTVTESSDDDITNNNNPFRHVMSDEDEDEGGLDEETAEAHGGESSSLEEDSAEHTTYGGKMRNDIVQDAENINSNSNNSSNNNRGSLNGQNGQRQPLGQKTTPTTITIDCSPPPATPQARKPDPPPSNKKEKMGDSKRESEVDQLQLQIKVQLLRTELDAATAQLRATSDDLGKTKAELKSNKEHWQKIVDELQLRIIVLKKQLVAINVLEERPGMRADDDVGMENGHDTNDPAVLKAIIEQRDRRVAELEEQLRSGEQLRRALHNRVQKLRGNIRVFARVRPPLQGETDAPSIECQPDGESLLIHKEENGVARSVDFKFDKVFAPSSGQDVVFDGVSEFVQSALDGYYVCLFSYGQTGSGKTHTMQGSGNGAMRGIIPRAVEQILQQAALMQSQRWTFTMKASFLEIYNEDLRDLLVMMNSDGTLKQRNTSTASKLSIKRNQEGKIYVDGINKVDIDVEDKVAGLAQLEAVMAAAARARSVATTKMNAQSSRSHSVFMLHLCGSNEESDTIVEGALNLCDLAGSERLGDDVTGYMRPLETRAINKSLSSLRDVFNALANGSKFIPFRNSKLTYLLQDCLSGDGKALMFVNLSPTLESSKESLCSLRFAQSVNAVELGKAKKQVKPKKPVQKRKYG